LLLSPSLTLGLRAKNLTHGAHSPQLRGDKLKLSTLTAAHSLAVRGQFGFCARLKRGLPYRAVFYIFLKKGREKQHYSLFVRFGKVKPSVLPSAKTLPSLTHYAF